MDLAIELLQSNTAISFSSLNEDLIITLISFNACIHLLLYFLLLSFPNLISSCPSFFIPLCACAYMSHMIKHILWQCCQCSGMILLQIRCINMHFDWVKSESHLLRSGCALGLLSLLLLGKKKEGRSKKRWLEEWSRESERMVCELEGSCNPSDLVFLSSCLAVQRVYSSLNVTSFQMLKTHHSLSVQL